MNSEQRQVDVAEPRGDPVHLLGRARDAGDGEEHQSEDERHERPGHGDPELGARDREHAFELGHAAEEPERDAFDLHPLAPRFECVPELVQEERDEEDDRGDQSHRDVRAVPEAGVRGGKMPVASVQTSRAKMTSQLQLTPIEMPLIRPSVKLSRMGC